MVNIIKIISIIMLIFIINIGNIYAAFTQKSSPQQSVVLGVDDILTHENHNAVVKDIANMIIDIGGLKSYIDVNLVSIWNIEGDKLAYNAKNVFFSKNLIVIDKITTNKLNIPESGYPNDSILGSDIKDGEIKAEDLNAEVFASIKETWKLLGLNAYYLKGNVGIGTNTPDESLVVNGNIKINTNGNSLIFPDGTKQTTAAISDANNMKLSGNQTVNGDKKFINGIKLATGGIIQNVENNITLTGNRDDTIVTEFAAKGYIDNIKFDKLNGKCGYSYAQNNLEPKNLCVYGTPSTVTVSDITELNKIRYIRDWIEGGNTSNTGIHWVEIKAIQNGTGINIAQGKNVTTNGILETGTKKPISAITDGDTNTDNRVGIYNEQKGIPKYIQVDLGNLFDIKQLEIYHYYKDNRIYFNTKTEVSKDGIKWIPVFDSGKSGLYKETSTGNIIPLPRIDITLKQWTCSGISGGEIANCSNYEEKDNSIKLIETGGVKQWSNGTQSKSCKEYLNAKLPYKYEGATGSGIYNIKPNSTVIPVYCDMTSDGGGWTLVYKFGGTHNMKTTGEQNISTLKYNNYVGVGKLSDVDIKTIYSNQFKVEYNGYSNWYCKFENIANYADSAITNKYCGTTYLENAGYTSFQNNTYRQFGFSTRSSIGARILQLNYRDSRLGAHIVYGVSGTANTCDVKSGGNDRYGCYGKVWIK